MAKQVVKTKRTKKPTKTMQIKILHDKLDEFGEALYYVNMYMQQYGLVTHYHGYLQAMAEEKDLPNKLLFSDIKMEKETKEDE